MHLINLAAHETESKRILKKVLSLSKYIMYCFFQQKKEKTIQIVSIYKQTFFIKTKDQLISKCLQIDKKK